MTGERVEVDVTGIAHGGISVARVDGRVIFVTDAIPGERVVAQITDGSKPSFWRADTVEVLDPSPHRRDHVWGAASLDRAPGARAGGAEFGHIELGHQRELKRQVLVDALQRMAGVTSEVIVEPIASGLASPAPPPTAGGPAPEPDRTGVGWRTRVRLQVDERGVPGPFAARSHRVIAADDLPLAVPEAAAIAPLSERFPGAAHLDIVVPSTGEPHLLVDRGERDRSASIVERVGDRDFRLALGGFWQVHRHAAATLTTAVQDAVDPERLDVEAAHLDLYGGVGLLAAAIGDRFGRGIRITSVESDRAATRFAGENLAEWSEARAVTARVDRYLHGVGAGAGRRELERLGRGTVVLDPPRSGAGKAVVAQLGVIRPAQIVYVACDPVALARDVGLLARHGYELTRLRAFDLFPNTHHVEAVATLMRTDAAV